MASVVARLVLGQLRGMIIDLVLSGDRERADRGMNVFIEALDARVRQSDVL